MWQQDLGLRPTRCRLIGVSDETMDPTTEIKDDNQLRGAEFKKLMKKPLTWILIGGLAIIGGIGGAFVAPFIGGIVFAACIVIGIIIVFAIADSRAEDAFFEHYATSRGLTRSKTNFPSTTNLLRKGDERETNQYMSGKLSDNCDGALGLYTYTVVSTDSDGNREETNYPFTVLYAEMPETVAHLTELRVQRKSGLKALEKFEDKFRGGSERVTLESEAMRDRYEIFVKKDENPVWVRRLFSPTFIVWLTEAPPKKFVFELQDGHLCCAVPKHRKSADELDEMRDVSLKVVDRIREEVRESS